MRVRCPIISAQTLNSYYRDHAIELSVPPKAIRIEPAATNTGQNIEFTVGCWPMKAWR
jgi:uncharacterized SAM-binding protein YcdF (DUF218 family)